MNQMLDSAAQAACACPFCRRVLRVTLAYAGKAARCRHCRATFRVPKRAELVDYAASHLITQGVERELRKRRERSERNVRQASRLAVVGSREVEDPFAALDAR